MPDVVVRPVPNEFQQKNIQADRKKASSGVSASWFEKGALGADGSGLYLIDADGVRHDIPCPPGGALVRLMAYRITTTIPLYNVFVADEQRHRVVDLPDIGFREVSGLDEVASAGGLRFEEVKVDLDRGLQDGYGYPRTKETVDMVRARLAVKDRHTLRHPLAGGS